MARRADLSASRVTRKRLSKPLPPLEPPAPELGDPGPQLDLFDYGRGLEP